MAHSSRWSRRHALTVEMKGSSPLCATMLIRGVRLAVQDSCLSHSRSEVQILYTPPRTASSIGRAPLLQRGSSGFESLAVHQSVVSDVFRRSPGLEPDTGSRASL